MKIIFIPDYRNNNLYQKNLSDSISKQCASVHFGGSIIRSTIENWKPDIIHIHWPYPFMMAKSRMMTIIKSTRFICGLFLLRLFGVKIIWTVHNVTDHEGKFKSLELLFSKFLAMSCDKLIVHCPSAKTEVEKIYGRDGSSISIIPHGNYIGYYENKITSSEARSKLKLEKEDKIFLYFGQIRSYKGVPELISAFKRVDNGKTKLLIVGKPLNEEITKNILDSCKDNDNIKNILEFVPDKDIQIYMNAADIVVLPYKNVLTSGAALLAMSFGRPIIAPAVKCIADTLDRNGNFLYNGDNLFETMQKALDTDRETLIYMGKNNLRLAEKLDWDEIGKNTYNVYQECIAG